MDQREAQSTSPIIPTELEIARNIPQIRELLETLALNGLGKPIYVTSEIKDDSLPSDDTLTRLERLTNPPPPKITKELAAIALPLSNGINASWLIITPDGNFMRVDPPQNPALAEEFQKNFSNLDFIQMREDLFNLTKRYGAFMSIFRHCSIPYNTATDYPSDEIQTQIEKDFDQALQVAAEIRKARLKAQITLQNMTLEKLRQFFNSPPEEKTN